MVLIGIPSVRMIIFHNSFSVFAEYLFCFNRFLYRFMVKELIVETGDWDKVQLFYHLPGSWRTVL